MPSRPNFLRRLLPAPATLVTLLPTAPLGIAVMLTALLGLMLSGCGGAGSDADTDAMLPERLDEWVRQESPTTYDRETIFDYINGAGEVYRSYAFADVAVARYARPGSPDATVEIFDMGTAADAYGVFSYARETEDVGIGGGFERKGSVLCFWQDRYYVCVAAEIATDARAALEDIARRLSERLPAGGERPPLVAVLPPDGLIPVSDRYFHTHQALNYHYYLTRENVLGLDANTEVVMARYEPGSTYLLIVAYRDAAAATAALTSFRAAIIPDAGNAEAAETASGGFTAAVRQDRFVVVVLDAATATGADDLTQATRDRLARFE